MTTSVSLVVTPNIMPRIAPETSRGNQNHGKRQKVQVRQGRLNFTTMADIREGAPVLTGIFSVLNYPAIILFDSGASHSFISTKFSAKCQLPFHHTNGGVTISTPGGRVATYQINRHVQCHNFYTRRQGCHLSDQ
jgi:hypothetical protein